jgi:Zn-dependent M16 (insulinase) family peptidase
VGVGVGGGSSNFSSGPYCTLVKLSMKAHHPEYTEMLEWIKDALWHTEFTPDRLRVSAQRMLSDVPSHKRNGSGMAACVLNNMHFKNRDYNAHAGNVLRQAVHLTKVSRPWLPVHPRPPLASSC